MSTEDLREQVARLLYSTAHWADRIIEHDFERKSDVYYINKAGMHWDQGLAGHSHYQQFRAQADALLPLFATRERAAAEKGWDEAVAMVAAKLDEYAWVFNAHAGGMAVKLAAAVFLDHPPINPYTVRAQLEGDGA